MGEMPAPHGSSVADAASYYALPFVRRAMLEYCGSEHGAPPTAAYVVGLDARSGPPPTWDTGPHLPVDDIEGLWARGSDISRSMWDREQLLVLLDIDYQNIDQPAEPYLRPAEVFFKLEPTYRAIGRLLAHYELGARPLMTGRGYQFTGRIPLGDAVVTRLAALAPGVPAWFATVESRRPTGVTAPMTAEQARASVGLGLLLEFFAQQVLAEAQPESRIPVVLNGTHVGAGTLGRECTSIDFSHAGDPLDTRHMRVAFSAYQWHRFRPDIFGWPASAVVPPLVAIPRGRESLMTMLDRGHGLEAGRRAAMHHAVLLPDVTRGVAALIDAYERSPLCAFHREFYERRRARPTVDPHVRTALPACMTASLGTPNDLLLRPEHIQHLVRGLMSRGVDPAAIAGLVQSTYEADHQWGTRWTRMHPATRAEFDVRVFAGLVRTGADRLVDFNCVSAQEKDLCPRTPCGHDLRRDRDRLKATS
jgi:hypothetical protein